MLIDRIYEAAVLPEHWPGVLLSIGQACGARGGLLFANSPESTRWLGGGPVVDDMRDFLAAGWMAQNARPAMLAERRHPGFLHDLDLHSEEETRTLPMFREFLHPRGYLSAAATYIQGLTDDRMILSIEGFDSHQASRAAIPQLDGLRPHLARAAQIAGQLRLARVQGHVEALQALGAAACVVNRRGQPQAWNPLFEAEVGVGVFDHRDGLVLVDARAQRLLRAALARMSGAGPAGASIALQARNGTPARVLHLLPVSGQAHDIFQNALAILIWTHPQRSPAVPEALLQDLFDLTPAEARMTALFCSQPGAGVRQLARELGVTDHTARSHLRAIMQKTGVSRQADLQRVLLSSVLV